MKKICLSAIGFLVFLQVVDAAPQPEVINLRPISATAGGDGPEQPITLFAHGSGYVGLRIPLNWSVEGSQREAVFTSNDFAQANVTWRPYLGKIPFADPAKAVDLVRKLALSAVSPGAQNSALAQEPTAVVLKGKNGLEAQLTFDLAGASLRRSVLIFEDKNGVQYSFIVTSVQSDFDSAHRGALGILNSWWTVTERDLPEITLGR